LRVLVWLLLLVPVLGVGIGLIVTRRLPVAVPPSRGGLAVAQFAYRSAVCRVAGLAGGFVLAWWLAQTEGLGMGVALALPALAVCVLTGVLVGELATGNPSGETRRATLEVRSAWSYLPYVRVRWLAGLTGLLLVVLTMTSVAGGPDDMGRPGRAFTTACGSDVVTSVGPWPGTFYSLPVGAVVLVGAILAAVVLRTVLRRPRPAVDDNTLASDDALRRGAARAITGACGLLVAAPLAGTAFFAGAALLRACASYPSLTLFGVLSMIVAGVAVVAACAFVVDLVPGR
jgi:hypothetical protein